MKRLIIVAIWLAGSTVCLAQGTSGELQLTYQRIQSFTMRSGIPSFFDFDGVALNGGGYGFVYNITEKFGLFQQMGFFGGVEQSPYKIRLITEHQGLRLKTEKGSVTLYAKGGVGFTRYVFESSGQTQGVDSHVNFVYGGGMHFPIFSGLRMIIDVSRQSMGLPNLTGMPNRSKWSNAFYLSTGIVFCFGD
jgi:hypothetical protein